LISVPRRLLRAIVGAALAASWVVAASPVRAGDSDGAPADDDAKRGEKDKEKGGGSDVVGRVSTEVSTYSDNDDVTVLSPTIAASIENPIAEWSVGARYLVDVVSAASVDIVATASPPIKEVRHAGSLDGAFKIGDFGVAASGSVSREPDYLSLTAGGSLSMDFAEKNVTALLGYSYGHDTAGRGQTPFAVFSRTIQHHAINGAITEVVNRSTVLALVGDVFIETGDQSKPYRYIPLFSPQVAASIPVGASYDVVDQYRAPERALESLPLSRDRFALTARLAHRFTSSTLRLDERFYTDIRYVVDVGRRVSFWPHARLHLQTPVKFWQRAYETHWNSDGSWDVPLYRTGDRELGPLRALTGGAGIRINVGSSKNPAAWALGLRGDVIYTSFLDDLYATSRLGGFAALSLDAVFE
jgi:hypothetical protein